MYFGHLTNRRMLQTNHALPNCIFFHTPCSIEVGGANPSPRRFHLASSIFPAKTTRGTYLLYLRDGMKVDSCSQNLEIQNSLLDLQMPVKNIAI